MILSGEKGEEYREIKPYYMTRFKKVFDMYPNSHIPIGTDKQDNPECAYRYTNGRIGKA